MQKSFEVVWHRLKNNFFRHNMPLGVCPSKMGFSSVWISLDMYSTCFKNCQILYTKIYLSRWYVGRNIVHANVWKINRQGSQIHLKRYSTERVKAGSCITLMHFEWTVLRAESLLSFAIFWLIEKKIVNLFLDHKSWCTTYK